MAAASPTPPPPAPPAFRSPRPALALLALASTPQPARPLAWIGTSTSTVTFAQTAPPHMELIASNAHLRPVLSAPSLQERCWPRILQPLPPVSIRIALQTACLATLLIILRGVKAARSVSLLMGIMPVSLPPAASRTVHPATIPLIALPATTSIYSHPTSKDAILSAPTPSASAASIQTSAAPVPLASLPSMEFAPSIALKTQWPTAVLAPASQFAQDAALDSPWSSQGPTATQSATTITV